MMRTGLLFSALLCSTLCGVPSALAADNAAPATTNWPMWRGPRGDGHSLETDVPTRWSATENVAWRVDVPGSGHSSPIVWGDRVFVSSYVPDGHKRVLLCLDRRDGRVVWERTVLTAPPEKKHDLNSYASATPATDGKHVWVAFFERPKIQLVCYDFEGNEVWRQSPGQFQSIHGFCSSPVLYQDLVILNGDQDADAYLVAYEKATGKERWRTDRPNKTRSYCTPLIEQMVASLVHTDGVVFVTGGFPQLHVLGVDPSGSGNVTKTHIKWRDHKGVSYVPSPIAGEHWFFIVSDGGVGSCFEAKTGKLLWKERLGRHHSASAVAAGGNLYFTSDAGETFVLKAGPTFDLVAKNDLGEECYASPAISRGQIFIRTARGLWCIGKGKASGN
jgi:outer membrane protein assembly factor BamB